MTIFLSSDAWRFAKAAVLESIKYCSVEEQDEYGLAEVFVLID